MKRETTKILEKWQEKREQLIKEKNEARDEMRRLFKLGGAKAANEAYKKFSEAWENLIKSRSEG